MQYTINVIEDMEISFPLLGLYVMNSHYATSICFPINVFVKGSMFC